MKTIDLLIKAAESDHELWRRVYPRTYADVGGYTSPKIASALMADVVTTIKVFDYVEAACSTSYRSAYRPVCDLIEHRVPTYFVRKDLVQALMHSPYPDVIDFRELHLPFESGVFIFPKDTLVHPDYGDCSFIMWGRCVKKRDYKIPGYADRPVYGLHDSIAVMTAAHEAVDLPWFHFITNDEHPTFTLPELVISTPHVGVKHPLDGVCTKTDDDFLNAMVVLAFNLFLFFEARPHLVTSNKLRKRVTKPGGRVHEFWDPYFVGKDYKIRYEKSNLIAGGTGEHVFRRGHWVRRHQRAVVCGPGRKERRIEYIDPYWQECDGLEEPKE